MTGMNRTARVERATNETKLVVEVDLDGTGKADVATGVGFYDHMLTALSKHSGIDLTVRADGDLHIDATTPSRTSPSPWARPSPRRSVTSGASPATATPPSRWTRCWCRPPSTCPAGRTSCTPSRRT